MRYRVLGTLEVVDSNRRTVDLGGPQARAILTLLLVASGRVVPVDALVDALWGDSPPASASSTLQSYVSRLRRALGSAEAVVREAAGYRLDAEPEDVDAFCFERLASEGRALLDAGQVVEARAVLTEAEQLWQGPALLEYADAEWARGVATRLEERRLAVIEDRIDADLRLGRHAAVVGELAELVATHPLREGFRAHLALALYRSGRQAEALRALDDARRTLRDELGVDPGRALQDLEARILAQDRGLDAPTPPAPGAPAADETETARAAAEPTGPTEPPRPIDLTERAAVVRPTATPRANGFVGRATELADLQAALQEALAGTARVALVEGEPGIGKTRLVEELARDAEQRGALVLWGRSHEGGAAPAFWPWLSVLRGALAVRPKLTVSPDLQQLITPEAAPSEPVMTGAAMFQVFDAVAQALAEVAAETPLVLALDDLQWADRESLELLSFLAGRLTAERALLVGTVRELEVGRDDALVTALAQLSRRSGTRRLRLRGLAPAETEELLEAVTGQPVTPAAAGAIHSRAEGNPFYATELARLLASEGSLDEAEAVERASVPASVRDVVRQRLAGLSEPTLRLLQVGATMGRDIDLAVLTRAADETLDDCLDHLDEAVILRLLVDSTDAPNCFRFTHALIREVLVDGLSSLRRARLHLRIADAIEAVHGYDDDDTAEIVADHLWAAVAIGAASRAATALERAADVAARRLAFESAISLLERVVHLRRTISSTPEEVEAELLALSRLTALVRAVHGYPAMLRAIPLERAKELAARTGRTDVLVDLLWSEWAGLDTSCQFAAAEQVMKQLDELATTADHPSLRALNVVHGIHAWHLGRFVESAACFDDFVEGVHGKLGQRPLELDAERRLLAAPFRLFVHQLRGLDTRAEFESLSAEAPHPFVRSTLWTFAGSGALAVGAWERAAELAGRGLAADPDLQYTFWTSGCEMIVGAARIRLGHVDEGADLFEDGRSRYLGTGARTSAPMYLAIYGSGLARAGRKDEGAAAVRDARAMFDDLGERFNLAMLLIAEAELAFVDGADPERVATMLDDAEAVARQQGADGLFPRIAQVRRDFGLPDQR